MLFRIMMDEIVHHYRNKTKTKKSDNCFCLVTEISVNHPCYDDVGVAFQGGVQFDCYVSPPISQTVLLGKTR